MKYAVIDNGLVSNVVLSESNELVKDLYPNSLIVEVPFKENLTSEENHLYVPRIGLGYNEETGYEQPEILEPSKREIYLNGKAAAEADGQTVWIDGKWVRFSDEDFAVYQANVRDNKIALKTDKARFDIPE